MPRITIACPDAMRADANHLGGALGRIPQDAGTYGEPIWRDAQGRLYSCASLDVSDEWLAAGMAPLRRPAWDAAQTVDLAAAARAQAALVLWTGEGAPPLAAPGRLAVIVGVPGAEAVALMGLTQVDADAA